MHLVSKCTDENAQYAQALAKESPRVRTNSGQSGMPERVAQLCSCPGMPESRSFTVLELR